MTVENQQQQQQQKPNDQQQQQLTPEQIAAQQKEQEQQQKATAIPDTLDLNQQQEYNEDIPETGVKVFDDIGQLLKEKKVEGAGKLISELRKTGELSLSSQAKLVDAVGDSMAKIILGQVQATVEQAREVGKAERGRLMQYAADKFGETDLEGTWNGIQAFAKSEESGLSNDDRVAMNAMLQAGGLQAELVIDKIFNLYQRSEGYTKEADLLQGTGSTGAGFKPVTSHEYAVKMKETVAKYGYDSSEAETLRRTRERSIQLGY